MVRGMIGFVCLLALTTQGEANYHHRRHHIIYKVTVVHKIHHYVRRQHRDPVVASPGGMVAAIRKTAEAAAPPPLPVAAIQFIQDVLDVVTVVTPDPFVFVRNPVVEAREYVQTTSVPSYSMFLQGRPVALACLNPDFVVRLADTIKEARKDGIQASVSSACRPPILGIGGMRNKAESMHAVGMAVDMAGIGPPGSGTAQRFYQIAAKHGIIRPYSTAIEWNHLQPTDIKVVSQVPKLKPFVSPYGPTDLSKLWAIEAAVILPADKAKPPGRTIAAAPRAHHHARVAHA